MPNQRRIDNRPTINGVNSGCSDEAKRINEFSRSKALRETSAKFCGREDGAVH
jgi:hypothetical protein